jgi:hypothetical protein
MAFDLSTASRKAVQQIHSKSTTLQQVVKLVQRIHIESTTNRTSGVRAKAVAVNVIHLHIAIFGCV